MNFQKQNIEYLILNKRIIEQHEIVFDVYTPRKNNVQVKKIMKQKILFVQKISTIN